MPPTRNRIEGNISLSMWQFNWLLALARIGAEDYTANLKKENDITASELVAAQMEVEEVVEKLEALAR
jgi:hypothetical protein